MITQIKGKIIKKNDFSVIIDIHGISYEIFIPHIILKRLDENKDEAGNVSLCTYHYFQVEPSKSFPVLIGFLNEVEKEFFESFISVSGIGPKAAVKALNLPISTIAQAIYNGDISVLKSLPGIGLQRAKEIVAKLQNKIGKFGLVQDGGQGETLARENDFENEALEVLKQLQYKSHEAKSMVRKALERAPSIKNAEDLLNEVYRQRTLK